MNLPPIEREEETANERSFPESKHVFLRLNPKFAAMVRDSGLEPYLDTPELFAASVEHFYQELGKATGLCPTPTGNTREQLFAAVMEGNGGIDDGRKTAHDVLETFDAAIAAAVAEKLKYGARAR